MSATCECTITGSDEKITLSEIEIRRGVNGVKSMLRELRQAHPELRMLDDFEGFPVAEVEVFFKGGWTPLSLDPLNLLERMGKQRSDIKLPPHLIAYFAEAEADPDNQSDWR